MIGRAGRPQFDTSGVAVILTDTNSEVCVKGSITEYRYTGINDKSGPFPSPSIEI
jgi:replicative superfamily II helicase